jgi:hypothetical protein
MRKAFNFIWQYITIATLCSTLVVGAQIAAIGSLTIGTTACNTSQIITDVERFLPAVLNILTVVAAFNGQNYGQLSGKIQQDATDVEKLINAFQATKSQGIWNDLNSAFTVFEQDANTVFELSNVVSGPSKNKVLLMVGAAQTLLAIIESIVPAAPAPAPALAKKFAAHAPIAKLTLGQWASSYNKTIAVKTGDPKVDNLKLQPVHIHSWIVRQVTFHKAQ